MATVQYRGRLAPSPSGHLHVGHARTFGVAAERTRRYDGELLLRIEDIDAQRCKPTYTRDLIEDLRWLGLRWSLGFASYLKDDSSAEEVAQCLPPIPPPPLQPPSSGTSKKRRRDDTPVSEAIKPDTTNDPCESTLYGDSLHSKWSTEFVQSQRLPLYELAWRILYEGGYIYPCKLSRKDVDQALSAPHDAVPESVSNTSSVSQTPLVESTTEKLSEAAAAVQRVLIGDETIFPTRLRPEWLNDVSFGSIGSAEYQALLPEDMRGLRSPRERRVNWRFRVPDATIHSVDGKAAGEVVRFIDGCCGLQQFVAGEHFGDFLIWRADGYPAYELAVVVDDLLMRITEVVRGQDLLLSTARQLLVARALTNLDWRQESSWASLPSEVNSVAILGNGELDFAMTTRKDFLPNEISPTFPVDKILQQCPWAQAFRQSDVNLGELRLPRFFHAPLVLDEEGRRLAKRSLSRTLRALRHEGIPAADVYTRFMRGAKLESV